jgi:predicted kinase
VVGASFTDDCHRREFLALAARLRVPSVFLHCQADPAVVMARLQHRSNDPSDADWSIYARAAGRWEDPSPDTQPSWHGIESSGSPEKTAEQAVHTLH